MSENTINRRDLLSATAAAGIIAAGALSRTAHADTSRLPGVQLYTVREAMAKDVDTTLRAIAGIGYQEVEFAGYFGHTAGEIRAMLDRYGLTSPSTHVDIPALLDDMDAVVGNAAEIGHDYVTIAWLNEEERSSIANYHRWAEVANKLGEACQSHGMRAAYHNHDFEFFPLEGVVPFDLLLDETESELFDFELDFYWVQKGGEDIRDILAKCDGRVTLSHIKDMDADGNMTAVGAGTIDFAGILADPVASSIRHCFVEHDHPGDAFQSVAYGAYTLKSIL